jgi:hypothetical protein|tara:strand:- start:738 stop:1004 length:267 start_codon:yes stop_codon:yes gene_type:complete
MKRFTRPLVQEVFGEDIDGEQFRSFKTEIESKHTGVADILCGLTVKMNAWSKEFSSRQAGSPQKRADFIRMDMQRGVQMIGSTSLALH